jgi:molybdenum cofactor cytidylyltransferase
VFIDGHQGGDVTPPHRLAAVVMAAGSGSRFSSRPGEKLLAPFRGVPMLAEVLGTLRAFAPIATVVVLGHGADDVQAAIEWETEIRVRNADPDRGLSSSLRVGFEALEATSTQAVGAFVVLGDQPRLAVPTLRALARAAQREDKSERPLIVPRYATHPGPRNPVLVRRIGWPLIAALRGDAGLASLIAGHPHLVVDVPVAGSMPDIDRREDLDALG